MLKQPRLADVLFLSASPESDEISTADEYEALTPSIEPQESAAYTEALNFACSRGDIRKITVTGAYGAGKSSVLRTWKKCPDNDLRIMTVSLAKFEMQSVSRPKAEPADNEGNTSPADDKKAGSTLRIHSQTDTVFFLCSGLARNAKRRCHCIRLSASGRILPLKCSSGPTTLSRLKCGPG